jgi:hypothetical protein
VTYIFHGDLKLDERVLREGSPSGIGVDAKVPGDKTLVVDWVNLIEKDLGDEWLDVWALSTVSNNDRRIHGGVRPG